MSETDDTIDTTDSEGVETTPGVGLGETIVGDEIVIADAEGNVVGRRPVDASGDADDVEVEEDD